MSRASHAPHTRRPQPFDPFSVGEEHSLKPRTAGYFLLGDVGTEVLGILFIVHEIPVAVAQDGILPDRPHVAID